MTDRAALWPMAARDVPPDAFAVVMATGIVSIAARDHAYPQLDLTLTTLATATFMLLLAIVVPQLFEGPRSAARHAQRPDTALRMFTFVAACTVLGARFHTDQAAAWPLAAAAAVAWLILTPIAVRDVCSSPRAELREHAHGAWQLASVATSGLAITAADLAANSRWPGWILLAASTWILAVLLYLAITALIGTRAATGLAPKDVTPDSWILMGALAIATLAGAHLHAALRAQRSSAWLADATHPAILGLWILASLWIPVLLYAEMWRMDHRTGSMRFTNTWWSAVFPLGMYSAATQATALQLHVPALVTVSLVFFWIAFSLFVLVAAGCLHSVARSAAAQRR